MNSLSIETIVKGINVINGIRKINRTADLIRLFSVLAVILAVVFNFYGIIKKNTSIS